ncbi:sphingomyelin phosphodiesterase-like [Zophobas morio]|uniref:sphingomyelin phosphodiesterase-like n=1 Tax=Zophobas morio TaxID=2755281 RepID=UPI003083317C
MSKLHFYIFVVSTLILSASQNILHDLSDFSTYIREHLLETKGYEDVLKTALYAQSASLPDVEYLMEHEIVCNACPIFANRFIDKRKKGYPQRYFMDTLDFFCEFIGTRRVCRGYGRHFINVFLYTVDNKYDLTAERICQVLLTAFGCSYGIHFNWSVVIPSGGTERPKLGRNENFTILQLSDIHYDPNYMPGGNGVCSEPLCCQNDQPVPPSSKDRCGYWGDYRNGDSPWHLIENTIKQTKNKTFDFVYYTGDIMSHRIFDTSIEKNSQLASKLYSYLRESFDVPIFPVLGNHEAHPLDFWAPSVGGFNMSWLYRVAADHWVKMVGQDVSETVLAGGYYTVSPKPGFRIIALNNNVAIKSNFWLFYNDGDARKQLQWLVDTLVEAERNNERVHIMGHVPPGTHDVVKEWSRQYSRIVERFASTIVAQFNGHTHVDELRVFYSSTNTSSTEAFGVAFNGAAVTPWGTNSNPSFKYYTVDGSSCVVLDYEEYTFNLTRANSNRTYSPEWYKLYSFKEAYGVENLMPSEVDKVLHRMATNHSLLDTYFRFYFRDADVGTRSGCDDRCKRNFLCQMSTTIYGQECHCRRFLDLYDKINS